MSPIPALRTVSIPATRLPVMAEADVIVAGGGNAGFIAAVAAARTGARVILIERYGYLGGSLTGTYATTPGFFGDSEGNQIIGGLGWEYVERMERAGAALIDREWWQVQIFPEATKDVALDMVQEAGVDLLLHCWVSDLIYDRGVIQGVIVESKSGRAVIQGKVFVDATGDADLAHLAAAPYELLLPDSLWQTSVDLMICNVDYRKIYDWVEANSDRVTTMSMPGDIDEPGLRAMISLIVRESGERAGRTTTHVGPVPTVKLMIHNSIGRVQGSVEVDGTDVRGLTRAEIEARKKALEHLAYLKKTVPGFEQAVVVGEAHLGVRETRRIVGDVLLTINHLMTNARFPDVVALNCRALDRHMKGDVFKFEIFEGNHDIPLRALIPQQVENLLVAGRAISCDHDAHSSLRGAATCLATGHAAGTAAALAAVDSGRVRQLDIPALQDTLRAQGAILKA